MPPRSESNVFLYISYFFDLMKDRMKLKNPANGLQICNKKYHYCTRSLIFFLYLVVPNDAFVPLARSSRSFINFKGYDYIDSNSGFQTSKRWDRIGLKSHSHDSHNVYEMTKKKSNELIKGTFFQALTSFSCN